MATWLERQIRKTKNLYRQTENFLDIDLGVNEFLEEEVPFWKSGKKLFAATSGGDRGTGNLQYGKNNFRGKGRINDENTSLGEYDLPRYPRRMSEDPGNQEGFEVTKFNYRGTNMPKQYGFSGIGQFMQQAERNIASQLPQLPSRGGQLPGIVPTTTTAGIPDVNRFPQQSGYGGRMNAPQGTQNIYMSKKPLYRGNVNAFIKAFGGDPTTLQIFWRAPRGEVVVYDTTGQPWPVNKEAAKEYGFWKPAKKPPISVKDWSGLKGATRTINKLKKVGQMAEKIGGYKRTITKTKKVPMMPYTQRQLGNSGDGTDNITVVR